MSTLLLFLFLKLYFKGKWGDWQGMKEKNICAKLLYETGMINRCDRRGRRGRRGRRVK
ncbi:hypothetical protein [Moraxella lacunata]|uniref:hypothetical protein n=1 Tax=Moraxella lacunata TaxID=477 RepID=UPI0015F12FDC|nr:hypothetical protein [Moraxella lacunata]